MRQYQLHIPAADAAAAAAHALSGGVIDPFVFRLSIFVLAIFVGYFVVWSVTPALHTPPAEMAPAAEINRYPDREFTALREGFADYLGHGPSR